MNPNVQAEADTLAVQLLRARYANTVAEALYQAFRLSPHARLADLAPGEARTHFQQIAEAAVMLACDEELRECAELYATEHIFGGLEDMLVGARVSRVRVVAAGIRAYLRFLRGTYPAAIETYRLRVRADHAAIVHARDAHARGLSIGAQIVRRFFPGQDGR